MGIQPGVGRGQLLGVQANTVLCSSCHLFLYLNSKGRQRNTSGTTSPAGHRFVGWGKLAAKGAVQFGFVTRSKDLHRFCIREFVQPQCPVFIIAGASHHVLCPARSFPPGEVRRDCGCRCSVSPSTFSVACEGLNMICRR